MPRYSGLRLSRWKMLEDNEPKISEMKRNSVVMALLAGLAAVACNNTAADKGTAAEGAAPETMTAEDYIPSKAEVDSVSYLMGVNFGIFMKSYGFTGLNYSKIVGGIKDCMEAEGDPRSEEFYSQLKYSPESINNAFNAYLEKKNNYEALVNKEASEKFLEENASRAGVTKTESGLQYEILEPGNDVKATLRDTVYVHYTGTLIDGTVFDQTLEENDAVAIPLSNVIRGWQEGLPLVGEGGHIKLYVPSELGYGSQGNPVIKPNSALVFDVKVEKVGKAPAAESEE